MDPLILRELGPQDEQTFLRGVKDWDGEELFWYTFEWKPGVPYHEMLEKLRKNKEGIDLPGHFVPSSMLYGFVGDDIIGRVSVRHELNENLKHRGGHIGYAVAPRFRGKGFAKEMVRQSLEYCRGLGLNEILVTCADDNTPSWKIIEHFGGALENKVWDAEDEEMIRRYWIRL